MHGDGVHGVGVHGDGSHFDVVLWVDGGVGHSFFVDEIFQNKKKPSAANIRAAMATDSSHVISFLLSTFFV